MKDNEDVSLTGDQDTAKSAPTGADLGITKEELATLRADNARLTKSNGDLSASERYWADKAQGSHREERDEPEIEQDEPDYDENEDAGAFVDDLSAKGVKALEKRGVMTKKSTKAMIEERATKIATKVARDIVGKARTSMAQDAELVGSYPELKDEKSEMFLNTQRIFRENAARDPALKNSPGALIMAAKQAKLELQLKGKTAAPADDEETREQKRQQRISEQSGGRSRRGSDFEDDGEDDAIGPEARAVLSQMSRFGVTDKEFQEQRKKVKAGR